MGLCDGVTLCLSEAYATFFLIAGLALVAYGSFTAYFIMIINSDQIIRDYITILPSTITILFGLILVILVFVGCCGICKESKYCVESYATFLILLAFSQLAFGAYCAIVYRSDVYTNNLKIQINADIENEVNKYNENPERMDNIQKWMKCCGHVNIVREYGSYRFESPRNSELPASCCDDPSEECTFNSQRLHKDGCSKIVYLFTVGTNYVMGWISIILGTTELVAALLGICLSCCIWRRQTGSWR